MHTAQIVSAALYKSPAGHAAMMAWYTTTLAHLSVPCQSLTVTTRCGSTHVLAAGRTGAPPVVLLHALSANALMWARQIPALAQSFRVFAPDIVGMSGRSASTRLPYDGRAYAAWLGDVLHGLGLERAALVGIDFSGWLIPRFAAYASARITRAALLSPAGFLPVRWRYLVPVIWDVLFINDAQARRLAHAMLAPSGHTLDPEAVEMQYLILKHFRAQFEPPALPDHELARLTAPTLVLVGEHEDVWPPAALLKRARHALPSLVAADIVPGAGHGLLAHQPEAVSARLLKFLNETA